MTHGLLSCLLEPRRKFRTGPEHGAVQSTCTHQRFTAFYKHTEKREGFKGLAERQAGVPQADGQSRPSSIILPFRATDPDLDSPTARGTPLRSHPPAIRLLLQVQ